MQSITGIFSKAVKETEALLAKFKAVQHKLPAFDPESIPARRRFLTRQIKLAGNLVRWRKHVRERSSLDVLLKRLVENCFLDVALSGWDVGGEELSNKVRHSLDVTSSNGFYNTHYRWLQYYPLMRYHTGCKDVLGHDDVFKCCVDKS